MDTFWTDVGEGARMGGTGPSIPDSAWGEVAITSHSIDSVFFGVELFSFWTVASMCITVCSTVRLE